MVFAFVFIVSLPLGAYLYFRYRRDQIEGIGSISHRCPRCHAELPRFRIPKSFRQALLGGWTCSHCGCEVDRHGLSHEVSD
jgi:ribosomal protein L37AE/L43A